MSGITGSFFALEPRIMFDGAAVATGAEVLQDTTTQDQTEIPGIDGETSTDATSTDSSDSEALWSSGLSLSAPSDRKEIVFIDTRVEDYQTLMEGIDSNAEVILLDSTRDGVEQIAEALNGRTDIDAIHLISHGTEGVLNLGTSALTTDTMMGEYADELSLIKQALSGEADLLIYGCNFAQGDGGQAAVQLLSELTGADVAASTDDTGAQELGGDWELEWQTGSIETTLVVNAATQEEWNSLLAETWRDAATGAIISGPSSGDQIFIGDAANNSPTAAGGGNDTMYGGAGDDTFYGGSGNDVLIGGEGNDTLTGDSGDDVILGGTGDDQLFGGSATTANVLVSGGGNDTMTGGTGSDIFRFTGAQSGDVITVNGDAGTDTIDLSEFASATITDNGSTITVDRGGGDVFTINYSNIENIITSVSGGNHGPIAEAGPDQMVATSSVVTLTAAGSADQDGDTLTYQWIQIEGDTWVTLNNANTANPTFIAPAAAGTLSFVVVVSDGTTSHADTVTITVGDGPTNVVPSSQTTAEDNSLVFSSGNSNQISITDPNGSSETFEVTLSVTNGTFTLAGTTGLTFVTGDGTADSTMTFRGTVTSINNALNGASFSPTADYSGGAALTIATRDSTLVALDLDANLQARYTFDSNADDVGPGTAQNGTLTNGATIVTDGTRGEVLSLDGVDDYVKVTGRFGDPANVTLAAWVNLTSAGPSGAMVISLGDSVSLVTDSSGRLVGTYYAGGTWPPVEFTGTLAGTGWHHLAFTFNDTANVATLYLDGAAVATLSTTDSISYTLGTDTYIGKHANGNTNFNFAGEIDDARIYDRALSASEVAKLANDLALNDTDTVAITVNAVNDAPTITSNGGGATAANSVVENTTAVTTVTSTDVDGGTAVYSISGGADAAKFSINSATGNLVFLAAPDYETPADFNGDNVYEVIVLVSDGNGGTDTQTINVTVTDVANTLTVTTITDNNDSGIVAGDANYDIEWLNANLGADASISLREAIIAANNTTGLDTIDFNISDPLVSGAYTIDVLSALPDITDTIIIDGTSEPDYAGTPIIELNGTSAGVGIDGLRLVAGSDGSTIQGLVINRFGGDGLEVNSSDNNTIAGNYIGTDVTGLVDLGNGQNGIRVVSSTNTLIGGGTVSARNVIAGNTGAGIRDEGSSGTIIQGNYIGVDAAGTGTLANSQGIQTWSGSSNGIIGGSGANEGNVIGGNTNQGILLYSASGYTVQGNYIGTDSTGTLDLGNLGNGIVISTSGTNHLIGGTGAGEGNVIAFNNLDGITVSGSTVTGNSILDNQIYSNTGLGIDLSGGTEDGFGVTANDAGDADTGANLLQNYPVLTAVNTTGSSVSITGTFNSTASTTFRIEFYASAAADGSGYGEAERYLGYATVTTDGSGNGTINLTESWAVASGEYVTATATVITDAGQVGVDDALAYGNTSEFSQNVVANTGPVNTVPGAQVVNEDTALAISGISVADSDTNLSTVQLSVTNGILNVTLSGGASISGGGNGTGTLTISGSQADINATLASLTYQGNLNFNGSDTLTMVSTDAGALSDTDTVDITINAVNDAPVNTVPGAQTVDEDTPLAISGISVNDVEGNLSSVQLAVTNGTLNVTLSGSATISAGANGSSTLTLSGSQADINATLASLTYQGNLNFNGSDTLTIISTDANSATDVDTVAITVSSVNDDPVNMVPGAQATNEDTLLTFNAANGNLIAIADDAGATLVVTLSVANGTVTLSGTAGLTFATGDGTADTSMSFSGTVENINAALDGLQYNPTTDYSGSDTLTITSYDQTLYSLDFDANLQGHYQFEAADPGNDSSPLGTNDGTVIGATSTVDSTRGDVLSFDGNDYVEITSYLGNPVDLTLAAWIDMDATQSGWPRIIEVEYVGSITFNASNNKLYGWHHDGTTWHAFEAQASLVGTGWHHVAFTWSEGTSTAALYLDGAELSTVTWTLNDPGSPTGITRIGAHPNGGSTFKGLIDDARIYNRALSADSINKLVTAPVTASDTDTVAITINSVNDAPVLDLDADDSSGATGADYQVTFTENGGAVPIVDAADASLVDVDGGNLVGLTVTISNLLDGTSEVLTANTTGTSIVAVYDSGTGVLTLSGSDSIANYQQVLRTIQYNNTSEAPDLTSRVLYVVAEDGTEYSNTATVTVSMVGLNDAPSGLGNALAVFEDGNYVFKAADFNFSDIDGDSFAAVVITTVPTKGTLYIDANSNGIVDAGEEVAANDVVLVSTITSNLLKYHPDADVNGLSADSFTFQVRDDGGTANGGVDTDPTPNTITFNITAVNDAPVNTVPGAQTATEDTALAISGVSVNDVDGNLSTVQLAVTNGTVTVTLSGAATISAGANGSNTLTLSGSQADINATLASLSYQGTLNYTGSDTLTLTSTDANSATDVDTVAITVNGVNDAPNFLVGDGFVTTAFGSGTDEGRSVLVQPDGKIVVVGLGQVGASYDFAIARYNMDGSLDASFGGGDGKVTTSLSLSSADIAYSVTLQPDGKILVAGEIYQGTTSDFALVRYNADGSLDTTFGGGDGIVTTPIGAGSEDGTSVAVQSDGKILVAGFSDNGTDNDFAVVRYNADGSLDASFGGGDGIVTTSVGLSHDQASGMQILSDGKILVSGTTVTSGNSDFALVQYNADGTLDTSFGGGDGIVVTAASSGTDQALSLAVQSDGKILVGGYSAVGGSWDFTVVRYNADGTLDTSFSGDGIATAALGAFTDKGTSLVLQADGKVIIVGHVFNGTNYDIGLARFNTDGTLDVSFGGGDGTVTMAVGSGDDYAYDVKVQADGKIVVSGSTYNGSNDDLLLVRFNPDGSLDTTFDLTTNTLDGTPTYIEDGSAVVLDVDVDISDSELDALNGGTGNYSGASLTLARHGGANAEDVLSFSDGNGITLVGGNLIKNSQILATFNTTSIAGEVVITFTDANGEIPTSADVDNILRQITYANTSNTPSANVQLDWTFDDGNTGSQGTGGALQATGSTVVSITAVNDVPVNTVPGAQTVNEDTSLALTGISVNDVDGNLSTVQLAVTNGTVTVTLSGAATISAGANGTNTLTLSGGQADINATLASLSYQGTLNYTGSDMLTITSTDAASATDVDMVAITVVGNNTPPVITNFGNMANATFSLAENLTAVASIAATDADEDPVSYSIIGGADAARFTIDATSGALRFTSAPDFENPQDTGGDNTYDVVVQASDGQGGTDTQSWAISVTDVFEGGMAISPEPTLEPTPDPTPDPTPEPPPGPLPEPTSDAGSSESTGSFAGWNNPLAGAVIDQSLGGGASEASVGHVLEREVEFGDIRDGQDVLTLPPFLKPSSWATTSDQIRSYYGEPIDIVKSELSSEFLQHLRASSDEIDQAITDQRKEHSLLVNMAKQTGLALSAGFVAWMVRGGALVASLMASLPAWRHFDPIPILGMDKKDKEAWSRRVKEAASLEAREHRGLEQILHAKHTEPLPPDSNSTTRSGSS